MKTLRGNKQDQARVSSKYKSVQSAKEVFIYNVYYPDVQGQVLFRSLSFTRLQV